MSTAHHKRPNNCRRWVLLVIVVHAVLLILTTFPALIRLKSNEANKEDRVGSGRMIRYNARNETIISPHLPRRLLTVFGLESSGTTFVTELLERSTGVKHSVPTNSLDYQLQHVSLPSGASCQGEIHIIPVLYPAICNRPTAMDNTALTSNRKKHSTGHPFIKCPESLNASRQVDDYFGYPPRYFVNITSHIQWYLDRGVEATAVLVVRDKTIGSLARSLVHCTIPEFRVTEEEMGSRIIKEAVERWDDGMNGWVPPPVVVVSYETLIHMGATYVNLVLRQLQLTPIHEPLEWAFEDGNPRYIRPREQVQKMLAVTNQMKAKPPRKDNDDDLDERSMFQREESNVSEGDDDRVA